MFSFIKKMFKSLSSIEPTEAAPYKVPSPGEKAAEQNVVVAGDTVVTAVYPFEGVGMLETKLPTEVIEAPVEAPKAKKPRAKKPAGEKKPRAKKAPKA